MTPEGKARYTVVMSTDTFTSNTGHTYTFRRITTMQAEILMMVGDEDAWTSCAVGPLEAIRARFERLAAAAHTAQEA